jgi:hypothetical protein
MAPVVVQARRREGLIYPVGPCLTIKSALYWTIVLLHHVCCASTDKVIDNPIHGARNDEPFPRLTSLTQALHLTPPLLIVYKSVPERKFDFVLTTSSRDTNIVCTMCPRGKHRRQDRQEYEMIVYECPKILKASENGESSIENIRAKARKSSDMRSKIRSSIYTPLPQPKLLNKAKPSYPSPFSPPSSSRLLPRHQPYHSSTPSDS